MNIFRDRDDDDIDDNEEEDSPRAAASVLHHLGKSTRDLLSLGHLDRLASLGGAGEVELGLA